MSRTARRRSATVAMLTLAGLAAGCTSSSGRHSRPEPAALQAPPNSTAAAELPDIPVRTPYVIYIGEVCRNAAAPVHVTGVSTVRQQGDLQLIAWGLRYRYPGDTYSAGSGENDPGALPGSLADLPGFTHGPATVKCSDHRHHDQLDVNVQTTTTALAVSHGFWVHYRDDSGAHRALVPFTLALCNRRCPKPYR